MKKLLPLVALLSAMALVGCAEKPAASTPAKESATSSVKAEESKAPATSVAKSEESKAPAVSSAPAASTPATSTPAGHAHAWTEGAAGTNADGKALTNSTCTCGAAKVEMALADASTGADNIEASGKLKKASTITWKVVAPKAGNATLQFFVKYGQTGTSLTDEVKNTIWGAYSGGPGTYDVKVGETAATVLVNEKSYDTTGVTAEGAFIDFATFSVVAGENVISLTTPSDQYYRNVFSGNLALIIA